MRLDHNFRSNKHNMFQIEQQFEYDLSRFRALILNIVSSVSKSTQVWLKCLSLSTALADVVQISFLPIPFLDMQRPRMILSMSIVDKLLHYLDYTPLNSPPCCILTSMEVAVEEDWWRLWLLPIISRGRTLWLNLAPLYDSPDILVLDIGFSPDDEVLMCWWAVIMCVHLASLGA